MKYILMFAVGATVGLLAYRVGLDEGMKIGIDTAIEVFLRPQAPAEVQRAI